MTRARLSLAVPCLAFALAGCGTSDDDAGTDTGSAAASVSAESDGQPTERPLHVHAVLAGGRQAGTYDATVQDALCAAAGTDMGGANLAFPFAEGSTRPGTLQNAQFSAEKVSTTGTNQFVLMMDVTGPDGIPQSIRIDPAKSSGTGSATITGTFPVYTAKVQGTTADGVKVDATLECAKSK